MERLHITMNGHLAQVECICRTRQTETPVPWEELRLVATDSKVRETKDFYYIHMGEDRIN